MKKLLITLVILIQGFLAFSQDSGLRLSLSSDVTGQSLSSLTLNPSLQYFIKDWLAVGGTYYHNNADDFTINYFDANVRTYVANNCFAQAGISSDLEDRTGLNLSIGYTAFINRLFIEPGFKYTHFDNSDRIAMFIGVGLKL